MEITNSIIMFIVLFILFSIGSNKLIDFKMISNSLQCVHSFNILHQECKLNSVTKTELTVINFS